MDKVKEALYKTLKYVPSPSQRELHESNARFKFIGAGARFGKSLCGAYDVLPDILKEGTRGWIVGPSYDQPSKEFRYIFDAIVNKLGFKTKRELNVSFTTPGPQTLLFPWGSEVFTKSEQNPDALLGEEIDWLILSEGSRLKEETYDMYLRARLGTRKGRVIIPTTPHGYNWLYKRFYLPAVNGDPDYWAKIGLKVIENPTFDRAEYDRAKKELPELAFSEQYDGEFVSWSGLIYRKFSRQNHLIDPFPVPGHWTVYTAIDPHPSTATGVLWLAVDEYGTWYVCHEMFQPDLTIPEITDKLLHIEKNCPVNRYLIDPNAKLIDKLRGQSISVQMQFRRSGIPCIEANNKFDGAWYTINDKLLPKPMFGDKDNLRPGLLVFRDCHRFIDEIENYTWENEKTGKAHLMDCYSGDTEVLTEDGWKLIVDVTNEKVATRSISGKLEFQEPTDKIVRPYKGKMVKLSVRSSEFLVTPKHRMVVKEERKDNRPNHSFKLAKDLSIYDRIPLTAEWLGEDQKIVTIPELKVVGGHGKSYWPELQVDAGLFFQFVGWYLSEGCCTQNLKIRQQWRVDISQSAEKNSANYIEIQELVAKLPWGFCKHKDGFVIQSRQLWEFLKRECGGGRSNKRVPRFMRCASKRLLTILWDAFVKGDGWKQKGKDSVASVCYELIGDLQEISLKRGNILSIYTKKQSSCKLRNKIYESQSLFHGQERSNKFFYLRDSKLNPCFSEVDYEGSIVCLTVPNGSLYVRRHGKPMWCGNCLKYIANDNPCRPNTENEIQAMIEAEKELLESRNKRTGY